MKTTKNKNKGFTLLEILLAVVMFTVTAAVFLDIGRQHLKNVERMKEKTLASWIAKNKLVEIQVNNPWPPAGTNEELQDMADQKWWTRTKISKGPVPRSRKIEVSVGLQSEELFDDKTEIITLTSFLTDPEPEKATDANKGAN